MNDCQTPLNGIFTGWCPRGPWATRIHKYRMCDVSFLTETLRLDDVDQDNAARVPVQQHQFEY